MSNPHGLGRSIPGLSAHPPIQCQQMGRAWNHACVEANSVLLRQSGQRHLSMVSLSTFSRPMAYPLRTNKTLNRYVKTNILSEQDFEQVRSLGVEFATVEDAGQCLLRILSDPTVNGHSLFLSARKWAPRGYIDLDLDDYPGNDVLQEIQADQVKGVPVENGLLA